LFYSCCAALENLLFSEVKTLIVKGRHSVGRAGGRFVFLVLTQPLGRRVRLFHRRKQSVAALFAKMQSSGQKQVTAQGLFRQSLFFNFVKFNSCAIFALAERLIF
jgi:hypothetical protein